MNEEDEAFEELAKRQGDWGLQGSRKHQIMRYLENDAMREVQRLGQEIEQEPVAWLLTDKNINSLQVDSIQHLIDRLKHAHHTDVCVRINGQDERFEADWLKDMVRVTPPQRKPLQFAGLSITEIRLPVGMTLRFENGALIIEAAHGIKENT